MSYQRDITTFRRYGINREELKRIFEAQKGLCPICGVVMILDGPNSKDHAHIDHCHKTNKIRGLICQSCNLALGQFKDSVDVLINAVIYLKSWEDDQIGLPSLNERKYKKMLFRKTS